MWSFDYLSEDENRSSYMRYRQYLDEGDNLLQVNNGTATEGIDRSWFYNLRKKTWSVLNVRATKFGNRTDYWPSRVVEYTILLLVLANVTAAVRESWLADPSDDQSLTSAGQLLELVSCVAFSLEYIARVWSCPESSFYCRLDGEDGVPHRTAWGGRWKWMRQPLNAIDLISLLSFVLDMCLREFSPYRGRTTFRVLSLLRFFSILKMERPTKAFYRLLVVFGRRRLELGLLMLLLCVVLLITSVMMFYVEHQGQPAAFSSIYASMYWSAAALTTGGYGDIYPTSVCGKILASVTQVVGLLLMAIPQGVISAGFTEMMCAEMQEKQQHRSSPQQPRRLQRQQRDVEEETEEEDLSYHPPAYYDDAAFLEEEDDEGQQEEEGTTVLYNRQPQRAAAAAGAMAAAFSGKIRGGGGVKSNFAGGGTEQSDGRKRSGAGGGGSGNYGGVTVTCPNCQCGFSVGLMVTGLSAV